MKHFTKTFFSVFAFAMICANAAADELSKPVPENCDPVDQGQYYLYNVDLQQFAFVDDIKMRLSDNGGAITFESTANNEWKLQGVRGYLYADWENVGCEGTSVDANTLWYLEKQSSGVYYFRPSKTDPDYFWNDMPDTWTGVSNETWMVHPVLTADKGFISWFIVSQDEYELFLSQRTFYQVIEELRGYGMDVTELVSTYQAAQTKDDFDQAIAGVQDILMDYRIRNASAENPVDVTSLYMRNPDFGEDWVDDGHDIPGWQTAPNSFLGMNEFDSQGFYDDIKTVASWAPNAFSDCKLYQNLSGLRDGKYRLGNYGIWIRHTGEDGDPISGAYIYAKVGDKVFREPLADSGWWRGLSEVVFETRTGEAEVGIMFENTNVGQCVILDFKLDYLGDPTVADRLSDLVSKAEALIAGAKIGQDIIEILTADISQANELIAGDDGDAQEALFTKFNQDYEDALKNKEDYQKLEQLYDEAIRILDKGESEAMNVLSDYLTENEIQEKLVDCLFTKEELQTVLATLTELNETASNSVIEPGMDVTYLLKNGDFSSNEGWTATLGDFSINKDKHILEKWWGDWSAEQVVNNVPNGTYRLEVQGFQFCHWDWAGAEEDWANGDGTPTYKATAKLRLNDGETTIFNVFACGETDIQEGYQAASYYVPNNADVAMKFFELGLYDNKVEATVKDNTLRVVFDCSKNGFWNCFYNLRLTYLGTDDESAVNNLRSNMEIAVGYLDKKMDGATRREMEAVVAAAQSLINSADRTFDQLLEASNAIIATFPDAEASIRDYAMLKVALDRAARVLGDAEIAASASGQALKQLYDPTAEDFNKDYPEMTAEDAVITAEELEKLSTKALTQGAIEPGADITDIMLNPSFEILYGQDDVLSSGAHAVPYGWKMTIEGNECYSAQEVFNAGINSFTAIERNQFTTDGDYSYCILSAPMPDTYIYQTLRGLPAGTYKACVDMNVTYEGGPSHLTGQRLLVNNNAVYYGKEENYINTELGSLHPEEVSRAFAGYDEVNSTETGESGDMGNMSTIAVEVTIAEGENLVIGVRTDNNKSAMNCDYEGLGWDCCGRLKIDNFRLYYVDSKKKGDVNLDGSVDINDVVAIINIMAGTNPNGFDGDVNKDNNTDINDVVSVINIMAGH